MLYFRKSTRLVMLETSLLESVKIETVMANDTHWLLKTDMYVKCLGNIPDAIIKLVLNTKTEILSVVQKCNEICVKNEMHVAHKLYIPKVIVFYLLFTKIVFIII